VWGIGGAGDVGARVSASCPLLGSAAQALSMSVFGQMRTCANKNPGVEPGFASNVTGDQLGCLSNNLLLVPYSTIYTFFP
jgi:hypothetical protein